MKEAALRQLFDEMRKENAEAHAETRRMIADTRDQLHTEIADTRDQLHTEIAETRDQLHTKIAGTHRQMVELIERLGDRVQFVGEAVQMTNERLTRETAEIRAEMRQGFADTHALVRFAYNDLSKR